MVHIQRKAGAGACVSVLISLNVINHSPESVTDGADFVLKGFCFVLFLCMISAYFHEI